MCNEQAVALRRITIISISDLIICRCMLIAVGSDESAASLVVLRFGLVELSEDQLLLAVPVLFVVIIVTDAEGAGPFFMQKFALNSLHPLTFGFFMQQNLILLCLS